MPSCRWPLLGGCLVLLLARPVTAVDFLDPALAKTDPKDPTQWFDIKHLDLEGKGWTDTKAPYDRLPAKAEGVVRAAVWGLSRNSAGMAVRFISDATTIRARWTLTAERLAMTHMPATGVSGLDLYARLPDGRWHWVGVGQPAQQTTTANLVAGLEPGQREYLLYLPLYNGVSSVEIGIPEKARLGKGPVRPAGKDRPILFYGTSITQGGCASRPGMVHTAILGRRLERPVLNFGFSGNGKMEPEVAALLAELDPAVYVIDCLPNIAAAEITERAGPLVRTLRKAHPETPIVLVEDRSYANSVLVPGSRQRNVTSREAFRKVYEQLVREGVAGMHYLEGEHLIGDDGEGTVDSSHPTDLGFVRQADAFQKVLQPLLGR